MFSVSKFNFSKLFFFSFRKMCLLDKVVCISFTSSIGNRVSGCYDSYARSESCLGTQ